MNKKPELKEFKISHLTASTKIITQEKFSAKLPFYNKSGEKYTNPLDYKAPTFLSKLPEIKMERIKSFKTETLLYSFYFGSKQCFKKYSYFELIERGFAYNEKLKIWSSKKDKVFFCVNEWKFLKVPDNLSEIFPKER